MAKQLPSKEQWVLVQSLFEELLDSANPLQFIDAQSEGYIREALKNLWQRHRQAEEEGFLGEQITVVRKLSATDAPLSFHPGQMLAADRFSVLRVLGTGGMGEVYLAEDQILGETVALKTIKAELGRFPENRARFLDEVRRARQVTHLNVCRIFDIFDHASVSFYSMEYLPGPTLAEVLAAGPLKPERAHQVAIQAAEGLWTAHKNNVLHCDFKPANIILTGSAKQERSVITDFGLAIALTASGDDARDQPKILGGTPFYMSPEIKAGASPSIRSDIYAFGKVLSQLLPGERLVARCTAEDPSQRPESMEQVLKELRGATTRRAWLIGGMMVTTAATAGTAYLRDRWQPKIPLGSRQKVLVNGFAPNDVDAKAVRTLLMMALRQSPLLNVVGDRGYRRADGVTVVTAGFAFPLAELLTTAKKEKSNLVIDGHLQPNGKGLKLTLTVYDADKAETAYSTTVDVSDKVQLVHLAEMASKNLRAEAFGESAFHAAYRPLEQITSTSTAAVDLYFRAVYEYEHGELRSVLTLLDHALALDANFVLAYHYKALALGVQNLMERQELSAQHAFDLRARVTERERNWIESGYYNSVCDWQAQAAALRKNIAQFPDEAVFERQLALALARLGQYDEAIQHNKRSVEIDPFGDNNTSELLMNLAEANRIQEFFDVKDYSEANGRKPDKLSLGFACLQQSDYPAALQHFEELTDVNSKRLRVVAPLILTGRFLEAINALSGDIAADEAKPDAERDETRTYMRRAWLGELYRLTDRPQLAAQQAEFLVNLKPMGCNLIALREGSLLALELKDIPLAERGLDKLSEVASRWPSQHSQSAVWLTQAQLAHLRGDADSAELFAKAKSAWPDPLNLFAISRSEGKAGLFEAQLASLREIERMRGKIFRLHFAGLAVLVWLEQARCLRNLAEFRESLRLYDRVAEHWGNPQAAGTLMREVSNERNELKGRIA